MSEDTPDCPFCNLTPDRVLEENALSVSLRDHCVQERHDAYRDYALIRFGLKEFSGVWWPRVHEAIKKIEKAMDFVEQSLSNEDTDSAITTLEFIEKSLSDVSRFLGSTQSNKSFFAQDSIKP